MAETSDELPPDIDRVMDFRDSVDSESDRGCALLAVSFLDVELRHLLKQCFVADPNIDDDLFGAHGPFSSFSSRIDAAYYLGKLPGSMRRELHLLRRLRNDFGHDPKPIDFSTPSIKSRCRELRWSFKEASATSRQHFTASVMALLAWIHHEARQSTPPTAANFNPPNEEMMVEFRKRVAERTEAIRERRNRRAEPGQST